MSPAGPRRGNTGSYWRWAGGLRTLLVWERASGSSINAVTSLMQLDYDYKKLRSPCHHAGTMELTRLAGAETTVLSFEACRMSGRPRMNESMFGQTALTSKFSYVAADSLYLKARQVFHDYLRRAHSASSQDLRASISSRPAVRTDAGSATEVASTSQLR